MADERLEQSGFWEKSVDLFERLFALKITEEERLHLAAADPGNIYIDDVSGRRPNLVAAILALLFHLLLFVVYLPGAQQELFITDQAVLRLRDLAKPAGGGPPEVEQPKVEVEKRVAPEPKPAPVPIPDPTPLEPDPIIKEASQAVAPVVDELVLDLNIGDITGPPTGSGSAGSGAGQGNQSGPGSGQGGDGVYTVGGGVRPPELIKQTSPSYTDEAIKAKVQGTILLQVVVREDGSVDSFKVLRPLGYGLEDRAINEIANNWVFRPGTKDGKPVPVLATIEVTFTLR